MDLDQTALFVFAGMTVVVLGFIAFLRYLKMRERLALIEKGLWPPAGRDAESPVTRKENGDHRHRQVDADQVRAGLISASVGLALAAGLYLASGFSLWLVTGLLPLFVGLALAVSGLLGHGKEGDTIRAGLITSGVGLALSIGIIAAWGASIVVLIGLLPLTIGFGIALAEILARQ